MSNHNISSLSAVTATALNDAMHVCAALPPGPDRDAAKRTMGFLMSARLETLSYYLAVLASESGGGQ